MAEGRSEDSAWAICNASMKAAETVDRFWNLVDKSGDCWLWTGAVDGKGYGRFNNGDVTVIAHRFAYGLDHNLDPDLQLDHTCRNTSCVRASHLEPVTIQENLRRRSEAMTDNSHWNADDKGFGSPSDAEELGWELMARRFPQADVNYNPLGATGEKGCANCQWFIGPDKCLVVQDWPQPITPNGISDQWRKVVIPQDMVEAKASVGKRPPMLGKNRVPGWDRLVKAFLGATGKEAQPAQPEALMEWGNDTNWMFTKDKDGQLWWMAVATNNFRDNDYPPEIFTAKAHQDFINKLDRGDLPMPELWYWHQPGTRWGEAKMAGFDGGLVWYAGTVDRGMEHVAQKVAAIAPWLRVSHGYRNFKYDDKARGIIGQYETFEVSPLPIGREANPITAFAISDKEMASMEISADKRDHIIGLFGKDWTESFEKRMTAQADAAQAEGREQKDANAAPQAGAVTPQPTPQEPEPAPAGAEDQKAQVDALATALLNSEGFKSLRDSVGGIAEAVSEIPSLKERVTAMEQKMAEGDQARLDALVAAKVLGTTAAQATAPSESAKNVVTDQEMEQYGAPALGFNQAFLDSLKIPTP